MIDKIKHHRAYVSFLKFIKPRVIPTMQETGGISKGHIVTAYQNGSVNVSKLKIPIISKLQKEVAINTGRCITLLIIPWIRNDFLVSFIFSQTSHIICTYFSPYICNVEQLVKFKLSNCWWYHSILYLGTQYGNRARKMEILRCVQDDIGLRDTAGRCGHRPLLSRKELVW